MCFTFPMYRNRITLKNLQTNMVPLIEVIGISTCNYVRPHMDRLAG